VRFGFNAIGVKGKLFSFISSEGSQNIGKGSFAPSQLTPRKTYYFVILSEAKDLRLFPKNDKNSFWVELEEGTFPSSND